LTGCDLNTPGDFEGTSFANVAGTLYELAGGPHYSVTPAVNICSSSRIFNTSFVYQGTLLEASFMGSAYFAPGANSPCSHPTLFQHPDGAHVVLLTFLGGQFTGGNVQTIGQPVIEISTP
jgi:hypothetical protein